MKQLLRDKDRSLRDTIALLIVFFCISIIFFCLPSCTASLNVISSQGKAQDMVDETQEPDISPELSLPVKPL